MITQLWSNFLDQQQGDVQEVDDVGDPNVTPIDEGLTNLEQKKKRCHGNSLEETVVDDDDDGKEIVEVVVVVVVEQVADRIAQHGTR